MFVAALFIIAKTWQPRCPSVGEWINKLWNLLLPDGGILVSVKGNELSSHEKTWRELTCVFLSDKIDL